MTRNAWLGLSGLVVLLAGAAPSMAGDWGFSVNVGRGRHYYDDCRPRVYSYSYHRPVYYDCGPVIVHRPVYRPVCRPVYRDYYVGRPYRSVTVRSYGPRYRYVAPAPRYHGGHVRVIRR